MRLWESIEEIARDLDTQSRNHDFEAGRWQQVIHAKGDCSVIPGWRGKIAIKVADRARERELAFAAAKRRTADSIREAISQNVPLRAFCPLSVIGDYTLEQAQALANLRGRAVNILTCDGAEPYLKVSPQEG